MSLAAATLRSALWNHGGKITEYVLMYVASLVIARGLGVQDNGGFASIVSLSQLLLVLCSFGLEAVVNKNFAQLDPEKGAESRRYLFRRIVATRGALFVLAAGSVAFLSALVPGLPGPARNLMLAVIAYAASRSLVPLLSIALTVEMRTETTAIVSVAARVFELVMVIVGSMSELKLAFVLYTFIASGFLQLAVYCVTCRGMFLGPARPVPLKPLLAFGGIFWINALMDYVLGRHGDIFLLSRLLPDQGNASFYDVSFSTMQLAQLAATAGLGGVTFAAFAALAVRSPDSMTPFYMILVRSVTLLTVPLFAFLLFNGDVILLGLYGPAFIDAAGLIQGMAAFRIVSRLFAGGENAEFLLSVGGVSQLVRAGFIAACCNLGLNFLLIPRLGAGGSVIASGTANLVVNIMGYMLVRQRAPVSLQPLHWARVTFVACGLSFAVHLIGTGAPGPTLVLRFLLFCAMMILSVLLFRLIPPDDIDQLGDAARGLFTGTSERKIG